MQMDRIDELLERATPNLSRRNHLRSVFHEWERVKRSLGESGRIHLPFVVREEPEPENGAALISGVDAEELLQIRDELEEAGVRVTIEPPPGEALG